MSSWVGSPRSGFYLRELIRGVGDEHARLADGPVAHDDALDRLGRSIHGERDCAIDARIAVTVVCFSSPSLSSPIDNNFLTSCHCRRLSHTVSLSLSSAHSPQDIALCILAPPLVSMTAFLRVLVTP